ncbi:sec-independent protein translocase protein TatB [Neisseria perflava]|uniref:Sec-independent protein translocase protein TatB n=1 Tax=Neisseria perflava TaxID=33053 RepID=UPI00209E9BB2|nr:Sec-independent protein translocase protein TatB [Neisseria perflava]MCP1773353.1 sec-independent protein translocase protein TatB [Neisseria perflava]
MFDFGLSELLLVGVVALVVLGPERLPKAARMAGNLVGKLQRLVSNVKQELSVQAELEDLRKAKQEFEAAAAQFKDEFKDLGQEAQSNLNQISDGLKPWERLPEQRTPADFGVDEQGNPLPDATPRFDENGQPVTPVAADSESSPDKAWQDYLTNTAMPSETAPFRYSETPPPVSGLGLHTASLHKQAMSRKRDMRPKFRPQPKLRVRKK